MMPPRLLKIESCQHDYTVKATISGITILKQNRFRTRYTGSKSSAVDINGKLWLDIKELKKITNPGSDRPKKKGAVSAETAPNPLLVDNKFNDFLEDLPTHEQNFYTALEQLYTQEPVLSPKVKGYKVNGTQVRQRLLGMIHTKAGKKELYFWTITFPKGTSDDIAYQAFNTWLTTLRTIDKFGRRFLKNYLWVAERQDGKRLNDPTKPATNTIHFHIAIPHRMDIKHANGVMQTILKNLSIKGLIPFTIHQCKRYNGVDIAKNRNTKRVTNFAIKKGSRALTTYLTKYVTKNTTEFTRLAWHHSRGFSALYTGITYTHEEFIVATESRITAEGEPVDVKWIHFLKKPPPLRNSKGEIVTNSKGEQVPDFSVFEYEYFFFIPWQFMAPPSILNRLVGLNDYVQEMTNSN